MIVFFGKPRQGVVAVMVTFLWATTTITVVNGFVPANLQPRSITTSSQETSGSTTTAMVLRATARSEEILPSPPPPPRTEAQRYFQDRITASRQRALLASLRRGGGDDSALRVLGRRRQNDDDDGATAIVTTTTTNADAEASSSSTMPTRRDYFAGRIALTRQRALLANIVEATGEKLTTSTLQGLQRAAVEVPFVSPAVAITQRLEADRQRDLLRRIQNARRHRFHHNNGVGTASTTTPPVRAPVVVDLTPEQQQRQQYFASRIAATRQRALLDGIASTKAARKLTTDTLQANDDRRPYYASIQQQQPSSSSSTEEVEEEPQNFFARRIRAARQRTLLNDIAGTRATQTQTALGSRRGAATVAAAKVPETPAVVTTTTTTTTVEEPQNFFARRIQAARQKTLLNDIAGTKATQTLSTLPHRSVDTLRRQEYFRQRIAESRERASARVRAAAKKTVVSAPSESTPVTAPETVTAAPSSKGVIYNNNNMPKRVNGAASSKAVGAPTVTNGVASPQVNQTPVANGPRSSSAPESSFDAWESPMMKPFKATSPKTDSLPVVPKNKSFPPLMNGAGKSSSVPKYIPPPPPTTSSGLNGATPKTSVPKYIPKTAASKVNGQSSSSPTSLPKFVPPPKKRVQPPMNTVHGDQDAMDHAVQMSNAAQKSWTPPPPQGGGVASMPKQPTMMGLDANSVNSAAPPQPFTSNHMAGAVAPTMKPSWAPKNGSTSPADAKAPPFAPKTGSEFRPAAGASVPPTPIPKPFAPKKAADLKQGIASPPFASKGPGKGSFSPPGNGAVPSKQPWASKQTAAAQKGFAPQPNGNPFAAAGNKPWETPKDGTTTAPALAGPNKGMPGLNKTPPFQTAPNGQTATTAKPLSASPFSPNNAPGPSTPRALWGHAARRNNGALKDDDDSETR